MAEKVIEILGLMVLPLILIGLFLFFYFGPEGTFEKVDSSVGTITEDYLAQGDSTFEDPTKVSILDRHRKEILELNDTIHEMLHSGKRDCFANYGGFSELNEEGTSIVMTYNSQEDTTEFSVYGGAGGKQIVTDLLFSIEGMTPCVIAGTEEIADAFFTKFIDKGQINGRYYTSVNSLKISYDQGTGWSGATCGDGNKIFVPEFGNDAVNDECDNFEEGGWLFTPDGKNICFFPTVDEEDSSEDGLEDDYVQAEESSPENSINHKVARRELATCS